MQKMKRLLAVVLSACMILFMGVSVYAAGEEAKKETGTITIENPVEGQSYKAYKVFDLESYDTESGAYSYKLNDAFETFARQDSIRGKYITLTESGSSFYVNWIEGASAAEFAQQAVAWANANDVTPEGTIASASEESKTITDLPLGYYVVDSSLGTVCSLTTTDPNATIKEKNSVPSVEKKVLDQKTLNYEKENTAQIGDTIAFKTVVNVGTGATGLVLHDQMDTSLTLNENSFDITVEGAAVSTDAYTITCKNTEADTFEIAFHDAFVSALKANSDIIVQYTAVLNSNAKVISDGSNNNKTWLVYGDNHTKTTESTTKTYTFAVDVIKTNKSAEVIDGAKFKLYDSETNGKQINLIKVSENAAKGEYVYRLADMTNTSDQQAVQTAKDAGLDYITAGKVTIKGLNADKYYLEEISAPAGYNKLSGRVLINMTGATTDNKAVVDHGGTLGKYHSGGVQIINNAGTILPGTGGAGTTAIYLLGAAIVILAITAWAIIRRSSRISK